MGTATGFFSDTRHDKIAPLEHREEDFAANIGVASLVIGHDALRRRQNGHTEAVVDARQVLHRRINPAARLRDTLDFA